MFRKVFYRGSAFHGRALKSITSSFNKGVNNSVVHSRPAQHASATPFVQRHKYSKTGHCACSSRSAVAASFLNTGATQALLSGLQQRRRFYSTTTTTVDETKNDLYEVGIDNIPPQPKYRMNIPTAQKIIPEIPAPKLPPATPLTQPYNITPIPPLQPVDHRFQDDPIMKQTILPNKLRVATLEHAASTSVSSVGIYIRTGSRFEKKPGITAMLERLAFRTSKDFQDLAELTNYLQDMGASINVLGDREFLTYSGEVLRDNLPKMLHVMSDTLLNPSLTEEEIAEVKMSFQLIEQENASNPEMTLGEKLCEVAYGENSPLGSPYIPPYEQIETITRKDLIEFIQAQIIPENVVIVGTGVDHDEFVAMVDRYFGQFKNTLGVEPTKPTPVPWVGGEYRYKFLETPQHYVLAEMKPLTHVIVALPSFSINDPDFYAVHVLQSLLGGGSSFSSGGPGKGIHTRLYTHFLNRLHWLERIEASVTQFGDTGIFLLYAASRHEQAHMLIDHAVVKALLTMTYNVSDVDLMRAKNQLKSKILMGLEGRAKAIAEVGLGLALYGQYVPGSELCRRVDMVTREDLERAGARLLEGATHPGIVVVGNTDRVESYKQIVYKLTDRNYKQYARKSSKRSGLFAQILDKLNTPK